MSRHNALSFVNAIYRPVIQSKVWMDGYGEMQRDWTQMGRLMALHCDIAGLWDITTAVLLLLKN